MGTLSEAIDVWMRSERVGGVAFSVNESVQIISGDHAGCSGSIISLVRLQPTTAYVVELSSGSDIEVEEAALVGASAMADAAAFAVLQRWYASRCNDDWEHSFGVRIDTLDNPGWMVRIDLEGTGLEAKGFTEIAEDMDGPEWITCRLASGKFEAACAAGMLSSVIKRFVHWANGAEPA